MYIARKPIIRNWFTFLDLVHLLLFEGWSILFRGTEIFSIRFCVRIDIEIKA